MALNRPGGASACPYLLSPQQVTVSSVLIPQECRELEVMAVNSDGSGIAVAVSVSVLCSGLGSLLQLVRSSKAHKSAIQ